jgi:hypothetical protein
MVNNTCTHQILIMVKQYMHSPNVNNGKQYIYSPNVNNGDNICTHQMYIRVREHVFTKCK